MKNHMIYIQEKNMANIQHKNSTRQIWKLLNLIKSTYEKPSKTVKAFYLRQRIRHKIDLQSCSIP